jgi:hypothetical protein
VNNEVLAVKSLPVTIRKKDAWQGINNNWNDPQNWCPAVPSNTSDVALPAGLSIYPIVTPGQIAYTKNITIEPGASLTINSGGGLISSGDFANSGTLINNGTIKLNGTGNQSFPGNGLISAMNTLQLEKASGVVNLNKAIEINSELMPTSGTLALGAFDITLKSTAAGTANVSAVGAAFSYNGTGRFVVDRGPFLPGFASCRSRDMHAIDTTLSAYVSQGLMTFVRSNRAGDPVYGTSGSTTLRSRGTLNTGNKTLNLSGELIGVGNPYAAPIDLRTLSTVGLSNAVYIWDPTLGGTYGAGGYRTLTLSGGDYLVSPSGGAYGNSNNIINSGQAFMVVTANATNGGIRFEENNKVTQNELVSFAPTNFPTVTVNVFENQWVEKLCWMAP